MRFGVDTIVRLDVMRVLYDHQAFRTGRFSGIPRYFTELYLQYQKSTEVKPILPKFWTINQDYRNLNVCQPNITWNVRDSVTSLSQKYLHQNPSRLMDFAEKKTIELLKKGNFDVFHPTRLEPYFLKYIGKKPYVLTIHDLTYEIYPEYFPLKTRVRKDTKRIVENASRFIAITECTKRDFINYYDVDSDLVDVVYLGSLFEKYQIPHLTESLSYNDSPYLLFVGERGMHKNFYHFIEAITPLLSDKLHVICVGGGGFKKEEGDFLQSLGVQKYVRQETISDTKLIKLYQNAVAFIYPSVNEGFGLPTLEAFSCGCPVLCSNTSCFPEVGGDAALYFNPKDAASIRQCVEKILDTPKMCEMMRERGYKQLEKFSWKKCADETRTVYEKAME